MVCSIKILRKRIPKNNTTDSNAAQPAGPPDFDFHIIEATTAGDLEPMGDNGYKLTTHGVKDLIQPENDPTYTLTAFCTLDNLQDFKLDPPRGTKTTNALIVISDVVLGITSGTPTNFIVDSVTILPRDDVSKIVAAMKKLLYYVAAGAQINTRKRSQEWGESCSPAKALKCRDLGRHPSGTDLPEYTCSDS